MISDTLRGTTEYSGGTALLEDVGLIEGTAKFRS